MAKPAKRKSIHKSIKLHLGYPPDQADSEVLRDWKQRISRVCKPCWELKYCPYGPLVEQSPTLPCELSETAAHIEYLKSCLDTGVLGNREPLSEERELSIILVLRIMIYLLNRLFFSCKMSYG
jgi:hypothetical protein